MKKFCFVLLALCLLCSVSLAGAVPTLSDMPMMVVEDENTTVELSSFLGTWKQGENAFAGEDFITADALKTTYDIAVAALTIEEGKIIVNEGPDADGNDQIVEFPTEFDSGEVRSPEGSKLNFACDLLEDGNITFNIFVPQSDGTNLDICLYMVKAE